eukprot:TRINITY_DN3536_c0_g1_i3.p4 TRINITY_DN3536_c0_g1~~TRINITY_DN3536_c0_g1_i3.p4  ORF type:complete len:157 (-),score=57.56 TRINITY_DN3536_c0_g1_i3:169-639(-)
MKQLRAAENEKKEVAAAEKERKDLALVDEAKADLKNNMDTSGVRKIPPPAKSKFSREGEDTSYTGQLVKKQMQESAEKERQAERDRKAERERKEEVDKLRIAKQREQERQMANSSKQPIAAPADPNEPPPDRPTQVPAVGLEPSKSNKRPCACSIQ